MYEKKYRFLFTGPSARVRCFCFLTRYINTAARDPEARARVTLYDDNASTTQLNEMAAIIDDHQGKTCASSTYERDGRSRRLRSNTFVRLHPERSGGIPSRMNVVCTVTTDNETDFCGKRVIALRTLCNTVETFWSFTTGWDRSQ